MRSKRVFGAASLRIGVGAALLATFVSYPANASALPTSGVALPQLPAAPNYTGLIASSSTAYIAIREARPEEGHVATLMIRRLSDGSLVRTLSNPMVSRETEPQIDGDSLVQVSESVPNGGLDTLSTLNIEQGTTETLKFPVGKVVGYGAGWVLSCSELVEGTNDCRVRLTTAAGVNRLIGLALHQSIKVSAAERRANRVVVTALSGRQFSIDTVTGDTTELNYSQARVVNGNRAFWTTTEYDDQLVSRPRLHWSDLEGLNGGSVLVDANGSDTDFVAYGDRVALLRVPEGGSYNRLALYPVNLDTGSLETPRVDTIGQAVSLADGRVALVLGDTPTGRVVTATDRQPDVSEVFDLPARGEVIGQLMLDAGTIAATWQGASGVQRPVYYLGADGVGEWNQRREGQIPTVLKSNGDRILGYAAGTVVLPGARDRSYLIKWADGERTVESRYSSPLLGHGGVLLSRDERVDGLTSIKIEGARSGALIRSLPSSTVHALDGTWVWTLSNDGKTLRGTDTVTGAEKSRVVEGLPARCGYDLDVRGTWALIGCDDRSRLVVDVSGASPTWALPVKPSDQRALLGNGFVAWAQFAAADDRVVPVLKVASVADGHEIRTYGPARGLSSPPGPTYAVDEAGLPTVVYADSHHQPRVVDVSWAIPTPRHKDTKAPRMTSVRVTPAISGRPGASATVQFAGHDESSAVKFSVAYRTHAGANGFGRWIEPSGWANLRVSKVSRAVAGGTTTCFRVRARDASGNRSAWSSEACSTAPLDDRALSARGKVVRAKNSSAMGRTESVLGKKGASLASKKSRFRDVYVIAKRGPKEGRVAVYAGSKKLGIVNLKNSKSGLVKFRLRSSKAHVAQLRLVSSSSRMVRIDGIVLMP